MSGLARIPPETIQLLFNLQSVPQELTDSEYDDISEAAHEAIAMAKAMSEDSKIEEDDSEWIKLSGKRASLIEPGLDKT